MPPTIHTATPADAEAVANLQYRSHTISFAEFARPEWVATRNLDEYRANWAETLANASDDRRTILARDDAGAIVGMVSLRGEPGGRADLFGMHVDPGLRGQGIGRLLMQAALDHIRARNYTRTDLGCLESNTYARRFYELSGFRCVHYGYHDVYGWQYVMRYEQPATT